MSRFLSSRLKHLEPYTPGEQPQMRDLIKLNTNESPFPPSENAIKMAVEAAGSLQLYPDPECRKLTEMLAKNLGVNNDELLLTNGSDEILNFAFMAFCDGERGAVFPDITYGFYKVFADLNGVPYREIPLNKDFGINFGDYVDLNETIFIANPNAPTGIYYEIEQIEEIIKNNQNSIVVVDEAYVDFGNKSCVPLIKKYDNLLVTRTFSKSRSMAGARLGYGVGCRELIRDLNTIKYSTNPYNINSVTMAAGIGSIADDTYFKDRCRKVCEVREYVKDKLSQMGFEMTDSRANFIFTRHNKISGEELYTKLREKNIIVRHFDKERISDYNRITIGTREQMDKLLCAVSDILSDILKEDNK